MTLKPKLGWTTEKIKDCNRFGYKLTLWWNSSTEPEAGGVCLSDQDKSEI